MSSDDEGGVSAGDLARYVPAAVLAIALIAFGLANTEKTKVDYLFGNTEAPLILVLLVTAIVGALIAALVRWRRS